VELYRKLHGDSGKKIIYKMARVRDDDSKDAYAGRVIKYNNGKLVTYRKEMPQVWKEYFKTLLNKSENRELYLHSAVEVEVRVYETGIDKRER